MQYNFLPIEEAIVVLQPLGLISRRNYQNSNLRPKNVPADPEKYYAELWCGWGKYLSIEPKIAPSFEELREFARSMNFKSKRDWKKHWANNKKPFYFPVDADSSYRNKGWISWNDFLGTKNVSRVNKICLTYDEAHKIVLSLGLKNSREYRKYINEHRPDGLPYDPAYKYKNSGWHSWGAWLGTGSKKREKEILSHDDAAIAVRKLNLKSKEDWFKLVESGEKPTGVPYNPNQAYKGKGWKTWAHFLGYLGNGQHSWSKLNLIAFLKEIESFILHMDSIELLTIINSNKIANKLEEIGMLQNLLRSEPSSSNRRTILTNISDTLSNGCDFSTTTSDEVTIEITTQEDVIETIEEGLGKLTQRSVVDNIITFDEEVLRNSLDSEDYDFLVKHLLKRLWNEVINDKSKKTLNRIKKLCGSFSTSIKDIFLNEYKKVISQILPKEYNFTDISGKLMEPSLMQLLIANRVKEEKYYGNWSGTGAGKTLSAILTSRLNGKKNTLIICNNATVELWTNAINSYFYNNNIYTKAVLLDTCDKTYNVLRDLTKIKLGTNTNNYIILNYETFQQSDAKKIVYSLLNDIDIDFVVLDEIQNAKQRDLNIESIRKGLIVNLLDELRNKPNLHILGMSATPIINNLVEARMLIELITGIDHSWLSTRMTFQAGYEMYKTLTRYGIRYIPTTDQKLNTHIIKIDCDLDIIPKLDISEYTPLFLDQISLSRKLEAVKPFIKKGTVIYTHYVNHITGEIGKFINSMNLSYGYYTGEDKNGLNCFKNKKIDVLIASSPITTGVDGLQFVCNNLIAISLPWTNSEYQQLIGRFVRKLSIFDEVDVYVPQLFFGDNSFDGHRYNTIIRKELLSDLAVDGIIPKGAVKSKEELLEEATFHIKQWIQRVQSGDVYETDRKNIVVGAIEYLTETEKTERIQTEYSDCSRKFKKTHSTKTHRELQDNPEPWYRYHTLREQNTKEWVEEPYVYIASKIKNTEQVVGDFGCGLNKLKTLIPNNKVISFDHVAIDESVSVCDIRDTSKFLDDKSINVAVYSLALWGSNYKEYITEAHRVLKYGGVIWVVEPIAKYESSKEEEKFISLIRDTGFEIVGEVEKRGGFIYIRGMKS